MQRSCSMKGVRLLLHGIFLSYIYDTCLAKRTGKGKTSVGTHFAARQQIPHKRTLEIQRRRGTVLERWDGIDGYLILSMVRDPRFPSMPTYFSYASTFTEPINWGNNYGSRIRGYFVPLLSGPHVFFIESDNEAKLFLSTTDNPENKILICKVGKDHESLPMQFRKYPEQESYPINLKKGIYYYIEALHKEQYGNDSLAVAVQTPDKKFYAPIPSQFLWTSPPPSGANQTATQSLLINIAAKAGAKAGAELGLREAKESGARAGAMAGAEAGERAGAAAGVEAARKAATEVATKTLKEALQKLGTMNKSTFNIYTGNATVIPVRPGGSSETGEETGGSAGTAQTGTTNVTGSTSGQNISSGQTTGTIQAGEIKMVNVSVTSRPGIPNPPVAKHPGIYQGAFVYNREIPYYIPPLSYDPQVIARNSKFVDPRGFARVIVSRAMYALYAIDVPASQNPIHNLCWRITKGNLELTQNCQAFIVHIPGFDKGTGEYQTISFESICAPRHHIRQKNYKFTLGEKGDKNFDYDASSAFFQVFSLPGAFQFSLMRKGWYICRSTVMNYHRTAIVTDFNMASLKWLKKCSFALRPLRTNENPRMNCNDTFQPITVPPVISRNVSRSPTTPSPPTTKGIATPTTRPSIPTTPPHDICLRFTFTNDAGVPFMLYSSLKRDGYLVTGPEIRLKYVIKNRQFMGLARLPDKRGHIFGAARNIISETLNELSDSQQLQLDPPIGSKWSHIIVKFWAEDPSGKREILLNGKKTIYAIPGINCKHQISVTVTSKPKPDLSTPNPTTSTMRTTTTRTTTSSTPIPITAPPPPTYPSHFHIYIHTPPSPQPPSTPDPSPPAFPITKPPPPPKPSIPPCGPGAPRPCYTTKPSTTPPPPTLPPAPPPIPTTAAPAPPSPLPPSPTHAPSLPPTPDPSAPCGPELLQPCSNTLPVLSTSITPFIPLPCSPGSSKPCTPVLGTSPTNPPQLLPIALPTMPPVVTVISANAPLSIQGCMPTHGGTSHGACCMFPFTYNEIQQHRCTRAERGYRWCATTANYDKDKQWGFCSNCFLSYGGSSNGNCCHFPFLYGGKMYTTCTTQDETRPWCATTYNFDIDKQWGYCGGDAPGSISQPKIAFSPCSSNCEGKCVDTCPDYCCVQTIKSKTSDQSNQVGVLQASQGYQFKQLTQGSQPCPAICAKLCAPDCPVRCCHLPAPTPLPQSPPPAPMYCPQVCLTTCVSSCPTQCCSNLEQGVNRNKVSYTMNIQCPAACYSNCLATCPVTCCNPESGKHQEISFSQRRRTGGRDILLKSTYEGNENPLTGTSPPSSEMVRSKIVCPAICSKSCFFRCPKKCCNVRNKENIKKARTWSLAVKDRCKQTVGGSAQGACCNFPFIYKGAVYWTCTTKDSVKHWCSTTKVFDVEKKWGFCV
ncbi:LOW QUALITY PROTEIN: uncharacterized protein LOC114961605 [Acropora millepora]|uniref:LOW QUALITY PROTEIN: uncharacterized protein LOC114961605 n=1 Tax=Acropora millepora TaxID=45264 RepID=UPI001CF14BD2|nr:LOW QUALITY PROTEIN: uncharacterized protein LOC114961605 [Acropora millepora]